MVELSGMIWLATLASQTSATICAQVFQSPFSKASMKTFALWPRMGPFMSPLHSVLEMIQSPSAWTSIEDGYSRSLGGAASGGAGGAGGAAGGASGGAGGAS